MANVIKNGNRSQEFDRAKIEQSIRKAGADEAMAWEIALMVQGRNRMTSEEIRNQVRGELEKRDPNLARNYDESRRLIVRHAAEVAKGTAMLSDSSYRNLRLRPGEGVNVKNGKRKFTMKVHKDVHGDMNLNEVLLSERDMGELGVADGSRIVAMRN